MALMFAICSPQPNWIPRKPKLIFQICQNVFGGLSMVAFGAKAAVQQSYLVASTPGNLVHSGYMPCGLAPIGHCNNIPHYTAARRDFDEVRVPINFSYMSGRDRGGRIA
jgi:hypothetical protein